MWTEDTFEQLLRRSEGETLDFKAKSYDLSDDHGRWKMVKDVVCMANTPRSEEALIVLGVRKLPSGEYDAIGIDSHPDDADIQALFSGKVRPVPRLQYEAVQYRGRQFGVLVVPAERIGPVVPIKHATDGDFFRRNVVYFRRGSMNAEAQPEDQRRIHEWIRAGEAAIVPVPSYHGTPMWDRFWDGARAFERSCRHVLVVGPHDASADWDGVGLVDWAFVFDFDPDSDAEGILSAARDTLERRRRVVMVTRGESPVLRIDTATCWHFTRGLSGRRESVEAGKYREWNRKYGDEVAQRMRDLAAQCTPRHTVFTIVWNSRELVDHLDLLLSHADRAFGEFASFILVSEDADDVRSISEKFGAELIAMPTDQLVAGLRHSLQTRDATIGSDVALPGSSGAPIPLESGLARRVAEEIELVHLGAGNAAPEGRSIGSDFLRGAELDWYELALDSYDAKRDVTSRLERAVRDGLATRTARRINLYHAPGAGGTTVARRVLWDLHQDYPTGILHRTEPPDTALCVQQIASVTGNPVLLMVDGSRVSERRLDELYDHLRGNRVPVVVIQVTRRLSPQRRDGSSVYLPGPLSDIEAARLSGLLSRECPDRVAELQALDRAGSSQERSVFYYCLTAFGRDFKGLDPYVEARLTRLNDVQTKIVAYASIAHRYGQQPVPAEAFREILGVPLGRSVDLESAEVDPIVWTTMGPN